MATVSNTLKLNDSMGSVIKSVINDMDKAIGTMERLDSTSDRLNLGKSLNNATSSASGLHRGLDPIDDDLRRANEEQQKFNNELKNGNYAASGLLSGIRNLIGAYAGIQGAKELGGLSDRMTSTDARLNLIVDDKGSVDQLRRKIFASAQDARASYLDTAAAVSKLGILAGDAFSNNTDEMIRFTNLMNKNFVIGGASATEKSAAMYQLTQSMAAGKLQGDEFRSITENAPLLAAAIKDYMINVEHAKGSMKDWSAEGLLTTQVIKAALFNSADEVEERFKSMPMTWGQVWTMAVNQWLMISRPLLSAISLLAQNWSIIGPIVYAVAGALLFLGAVILIHNAQVGISNTLAAVSAARAAMAAGQTLIQAAATTTATGAQVGFNAALLACPITWIIIGIIALIALFYAGVAAVNKFAGTTYSATGLIVGALFVAGGFIANLFFALLEIVFGVIEFWYNGFLAFSNFFANIFKDPVGSVIHLFGDLGDVVLGVLEKIAKGMDKLFGTNLAKSVSGWRSDLSKLTESAAEKYGNGKYEELSKKLDLDKMLSDAGIKMDRLNYGSLWDKGYNVGSSLQDKVTGLFDTGDLADSLADQDYDVNVKNDVNLADESLQYLLDAVTQKYINKVNVTAPAPNVTVNFGDVHKDVDLDALAEATQKKIGIGLVQYAMSSTDIKR